MPESNHHTLGLNTYEYKKNEITFTPCHFLRSSGYTWIEDKKIISDLDPEHLGHALLQALALSKNPYLKEPK
ncbi:MAG: hypothetical protein JSS34_08465 [Proteobacteria bacterium]|nr:hypothetical protein [Pseudomonadota bacterium]